MTYEIRTTITGTTYPGCARRDATCATREEAEAAIASLVATGEWDADDLEIVEVALAPAQIRMTGHDAITYARAHDLALSTHTDPTAEGRDDVTVEEARRIASEDPSLVYLDVPARIVEQLADEAAAAGDRVLADTCAAALAGWQTPQRIVINALVDAAARVST